MKYFIKAIFSVILIALTLVVPHKLYWELNTDKITDEMYRRREKYYHGVINIWQIDSFEGGTGSRTNFLKEISKDFEKKNNGVFINVESVTVEKAEKLISLGQKRPDIISYGAGVNIDKNLFGELNLVNVPDLAGEVTTYDSVPWCMGGYFMIGDIAKEKWGKDGLVKKTKKGEKIIYSVGVPHRNKHNCMGELDFPINEQYGILEGTPNEIFEYYNYSEKVNRMIGTQRDLYKLQSLANRQLARESQVLFLGYTDLFQYISYIDTNNDKKADTINNYINFILEKNQQDKLGSIGMFPVIKEASPHYDNAFVNSAWQQIQNVGIEKSIQKDS